MYPQLTIRSEGVQGLGPDVYPDFDFDPDMFPSGWSLVHTHSGGDSLGGWDTPLTVGCVWGPWSQSESQAAGMAEVKVEAPDQQDFAEVYANIVSSTAGEGHFLLLRLRPLT